MKAELVVLQGEVEGKRIAMTMPLFRIGRGETCHLRPNSERVSREHAEFIFEKDVLQVRDLGSRNGTLVNGKPIELPEELCARMQAGAAAARPNQPTATATS
jgi:pSer/pThr/pTyr-binding forkhead associated (FHA) protein